MLGAIPFRALYTRLCSASTARRRRSPAASAAASSRCNWSLNFGEWLEMNSYRPGIGDDNDMKAELHEHEK